MNSVLPSTNASIRDRASTLETDEIDLGALIHTLWRGKWWISFTTALAILAGGYYAFVAAVPTYTAGSVVMLENRQENVANLESVMSGLSGDQATINTEVEVIRSRGLIEKLVNELDLIADPEFNPTLRPVPAISIGKAINFVTELIKGPLPEEPAKSEREILDTTINNVLDGLRVSNVRQSYVFKITAITQGAKKSADITNTLAELYILEQLDVKFEATKKATEWLTSRVGELQVALEEADIAVKEFSTNTELVSPEILIALNRQLKDLRDRYSSAETSTILARDLVAGLKAAKISGDIASMEKVADDSILSRIYKQIENGASGAHDTFSERFDQIIERAKASHKRIDNQKLALQRSIAAIETQIENQSVELIKLRQLQREAEASRLIYEFFLGRLKETSVQQGTQQADSRIISRAVVPVKASAPRKSMVLVLAAILGLLVSAAMILLREMRQTGIRTADQLEKITGMTVIGQIPTIPARRRSKVLKYLVDKPNSAAAESIRNLRTSLLLSNIDNPPKVFMSTSSLPGEGKTTQSLALAQNMAGLGQKVLLIEGDIRRRVFSEYFDIKEKRGLLAVLSGEAELKDVVTHVDELGADVLIGEKSATNAADIFSSQKFRDFLKAARKAYDAIIIDTPPVLIVPDSRVIGQSVDAIIYTVKWDSTSRVQVREGLRMFETVNLRIAGLVLSQIDAKRMKHYGYGGEYGAYGSYGSKYYHD
ncbi:MAG: polysaccharide biosynthesis tyrosine autokinase [Marinosulfonomonas sp.]|nr:polysaccharide biosynthesis tyrosine autokinase [Marinosulfonomonas sp.]